MDVSQSGITGGNKGDYSLMSNCIKWSILYGLGHFVLRFILGCGGGMRYDAIIT